MDVSREYHLHASASSAFRRRGRATEPSRPPLDRITRPVVPPPAAREDGGYSHDDDSAISKYAAVSLSRRALTIPPPALLEQPIPPGPTCVLHALLSAQQCRPPADIFLLDGAIDCISARHMHSLTRRADWLSSHISHEGRRAPHTQVAPAGDCRVIFAR